MNLKLFLRGYALIGPFYSPEFPGRRYWGWLFSSGETAHARARKSARLAMKFEEASRFVGGSTGRKNIGEKNKGSFRGFHQSTQAEGPLDIDRPGGTSLTGNRAGFDPKVLFVRCSEAVSAHRREDFSLIKCLCIRFRGSIGMGRTAS